MKRAVGVVVAMVMPAMVATPAAAEWRLYVNRDNKAWALERTYISNEECDRAARSLYKSGQALGVGCAEYPAQNAAQPAASRPAESARPNPAAPRQVARAEEPARVSASRSNPRVAEYPVRPTAARQAPLAKPPAASQSHPAAVIFPPSGGIEIRYEEPAKPAAVAAPPKPEPRRQAAPPAAQQHVEDDKSSPAVILARAAAEGTAASTRDTAGEVVAREAAVAADNAQRRNLLAVFGGVVLVLGTGVAYSVYRVARTSPLRAVAVCLIELGVLTAALAYPVVEMWTKLKIASSIIPSLMSGVLAGLVVAGVGGGVLAIELTRRARRPSGPAPVMLHDVIPAERKPQPPVEPLKPVEQARAAEPAKPVEPAKPAEPVRPLQPVRPLDSAHPFIAPRPPEPPKPERTTAPEPAKPAEPAKLAEPVTSPEPIKSSDAAPVAGGS